MQSSLSQKYKQVAAAIIEIDGKFLIAQRAKNDALFGKWEFPGGKVEAGETPQEALKRELFEEFVISPNVSEYVCSSYFTHKDMPYEMLAFKVYSFEGEIELREHSQIVWVTKNEF